MLPRELSGIDAVRSTRELERRVVRVLFWLSPALFVVGCVLVGTLDRTILFRLPAREFPSSMTRAFGVLGGIGLASISALWWGSLKLSPIKRRVPIPFTIPFSALCLVVLISWALGLSKSLFVLEESVKARAPQLDFTRNLAFKQQVLRYENSGESDAFRILLIGSSQLNLGVDAERLKTNTEADKVISLCMPGMIPVQYLALSRKLIDQKPTHVICWLSEFDFFRENNLPTVRLRWCGDRQNLISITRSLSISQRLENRSELADLSLASVCTLWQQRSLIQMAVFRAWWSWDTELEFASADEIAVGGRLVDRATGLQNARQNIRRTPLVDANFRCFHRFSEALGSSKINLIVIEGESHPETMNAYPAEFRVETNRRLESLSREVGFLFIPSSERPQFALSDWRDAVHLNETGRSRLTDFLSEYIKRMPDHQLSIE